MDGLDWTRVWRIALIGDKQISSKDSVYHTTPSHPWNKQDLTLDRSYSQITTDFLVMILVFSIFSLKIETLIFARNI